ncbi:MAG: hypothetical protein ABIR57_15065 [Aeromicrobium sp.]
MIQNLYPLAFLACPIGMGVMMWMMMRGSKSNDSSPSRQDEELAELRAKVDELSHYEAGKSGQ